tara:strand:+ start:898 stop:1026 length:129 start_codon:yes stop_codon:yes gene_type:complete
MEAFEYYGSLGGIGFIIGWITVWFFNKIVKEIIQWDINEKDK